MCAIFEISKWLLVPCKIGDFCTTLYFQSPSNVHTSIEFLVCPFSRCCFITTYDQSPFTSHSCFSTIPKTVQCCDCNMCVCIHYIWICVRSCINTDKHNGNATHIITLAALVLLKISVNKPREGMCHNSQHNSVVAISLCYDCTMVLCLIWPL